jgi:hypothetical protein
MIRQKGGGIGYQPGIPVNNIETFLPSLIPDLVLWIKANENFVKYQTIKSYINKQSYFIKEALLTQFADLSEMVITEILSDTPATPNSLIPLVLDTAIPTTFPSLRSVPNELDAINMSNFRGATKVHSLKLVSSRPVESPTTSFSISYGLSFSQNTITNQVVISTKLVDFPTEDPTAEFSELVIFSRALTLDETVKMEGYIAYKQNTQYTLPLTHPYLPNVINDPIFSSISSKFKDAEDLLMKNSAQLTVVHTDYVKEKGESSDTAVLINYQQRIKTCTVKLMQIVQMLSKAYLYARHLNRLTLDTIYSSVEQQPFNESTIETVIKECNYINSSVDSYIKILLKSYSEPFIKQTGGANSITTEISDHLLFTQQTELFKNLHQRLKVKSAQISEDGDTAYNNLQNVVKDSLTNSIDIVTHHYSDVNTKASALKTQLQPIQKMILSKQWLVYLPNIDTSTDLNGYTNPALNLIESYYTDVSGQLTHGDYAYILSELTELHKITSNISSLPINPVFKNVYTDYLSKVVEKSKNYYSEFKKLDTTLRIYLNNINMFITTSKETGQVSTFEDRIDTHSLYTSKILDVYIRKVNPLDSLLFGLEYVQTDSSGMIVGSDVISFFPKLLGYIFVNGAYIKTTPYKNVTQTFRILEPFTESVYTGLTAEQRIPLYTYKINSLVELQRNQMCSIHCVETVLSPPAIVLPFLALSKGDWCLIYNIGQNPVSIRNPGVANSSDSIDIIGSNQGFLYIYTEGETNYYGRRAWTQNQLPYDTVLNCPRASLSMFIDEIGTNIYIRNVTEDTYEPVYSPDGYLVEVIKADDGMVYDIDDVHKAFPYSVFAVSPDKRTALSFNPQKKKMVQIIPTSFSISRDTLTGFAVLLNKNGAICMNEYGYCKYIHVPIQRIGETNKVHGSYNDLSIETTGTTVQQPYEIEDFLRFESVFRTRFVSNIGGQSIFVTNTFNPIISPDGICIEVPPINNTTPITYSDDHTLREFSMVNSISLPANTSIGVYKYINTVDVVKAKAEVESRSRSNLRYESAKTYMESEIATLVSKESEIKTFGSDAVNVLDDAKKQFGEILATLTPETVDSSLKTFFISYKQAHKTIDVYLKAVSEIKAVKREVAYWSRAGKDKIHSEIIKLQAQLQINVKERGATSAPDIQELLTSCIDAESSFNTSLQMCINYSLSPPNLVSEVHSWYVNVQPMISKLSSLSDDVNQTVYEELPRAIQRYKSQQVSNGLASQIKALFEEVHTMWSAIQDTKMGIDTYVQSRSQTMSSDQQRQIQLIILQIESMIADKELVFNALYKEVKLESPKIKQINSLELFKNDLTVLRSQLNIGVQGIMKIMG